MRLSQFVLPILSAMSLLITYGLILFKKYEKMRELSIEESSKRDIYKIRDFTEDTWWKLAMALVMLTYLGFVLIYMRIVENANAFDAMVIGLVIFSTLLIIGRRMTQKGPKESTTKILNEPPTIKSQ